ncbi:MAG: hypothetical protein R3Y28_02940 [Candidatus Gastranaerophilales bacterium]
MKKKVIAYLHTHWDREWYREFEVFRMRLLRVFDNVLDLLEAGKIPSFYFDGQVGAILDYLEIRPEKEALVRDLIEQKKLFIGPCYCLIDEFLTNKDVFKKNLEIGLKTARGFGCEDFVAYFADTFAHSKHMPKLLTEFSLDKCVLWRGVPDLPAEFMFNGVKTVNLVRGYFMDIFSQQVSYEKKAEFLKSNLDLIAEKSGDVLLLPIGGDHLGVEGDIVEQIEIVNELLEDYEIELSSIFEYFDLVDENFEKTHYNDELRDNTKTFVLQGVYSARIDLKQLNFECMQLLKQAENLALKFGADYKNILEYAYKLLLKNQAHDGIYGCSTDLVHRENLIRFEKIKQIATTIIAELKSIYGFETQVFRSYELCKNCELLATEFSVVDELLYDTQRVPVTEDFQEVFVQKRIFEAEIVDKIEFVDGALFCRDIKIEFIRRKDLGDTYNFAPDVEDKIEVANVISFDDDIIKTDFFDVKVRYQKWGVNFSITWENEIKNHITQVRFILSEPVVKTVSDDLDEVTERCFEEDFVLVDSLPKSRGLEAKTQFAPMQSFVKTQGVRIETKGLHEYEVVKNSLCVTLLRCVGVISNPHNSARTTPAGPPIVVDDAQMLKKCFAEFSLSFEN